jgi:DNA-directed RNA polymerase subunit RPC12/RpoP
MWNAFPAAMSEFKYACPVCGQHIKCDSSQSGTTMECPTCFQKIIAPQAPESDDPKFIIKGTKTGERPIPSAVANAGLMTPVCEPEKKSPVAAIAFVVLFCAAVVALFAFGGKMFKPAPPPTVPADGGTGGPSQPAPITHTLDLSSISSGINIAWNKPASASSQEPQNPAQNGNDANNGSRWCASSANVPQWWEVDFGGTAVITNTQILWEKTSLYQYVIEVSSDNTNWTMVADRTANSTFTGENSDVFSASGRYMRIVITGLVPGAWASFYEFRAFGSIVGSGDGGSKTNGNFTNQP